MEEGVQSRDCSGIQKGEAKAQHSKKQGGKNHSTQDSRVVPHRGTNWAALWLTAQIGRDAVLSKSYGRGYRYGPRGPFDSGFLWRP
jgi:hypothetical protein